MAALCGPIAGPDIDRLMSGHRPAMDTSPRPA
jgi:hypothetical protein